jgi:hypothetical protein
MKIFGRNKQQNEQKFKVDFGGEEGLARLVDLATSPQKNQVILADTTLEDPIYRLEAGLTSCVEGKSKYLLDAKLIPLTGKKLKVSERDFSDFEAQPIDGSYVLRTHLLPNGRMLLRVNWPSNEKGMDLSMSSMYKQDQRLIQNEVGDALNAFGKALQYTINSVYHCAGKTAPEKVLKLEPMRRV